MLKRIVFLLAVLNSNSNVRAFSFDKTRDFLKGFLQGSGINDEVPEAFGCI